MANTSITREEVSRSSPTLRFYALLTLVLTPLILAVILGYFWIVDRTPVWVYWKIGLIVLIGIDLAYALAIASAVGFLAILAIRLFRGLGDFRRREAAAHGALLCFSIVCCVLLAESVVAFWLAREDRMAVVPTGGLRASSGQNEPEPPGSLESVELPTAFPDEPNDGSILVSVVGESSAAGIPYDRWLSVGSLVVWRLGEEIPGKNFIHHVVAQSGSTLELQYAELGKQTRRPDVLIIYCGHNEFGSRIEPSRDLNYYADALAPNTWEAAFERATSWSFFHLLVQRNIAKCRIAIPPPANGYRAAVDTPAYTEAEYARLLDDFRRRLDAMTAYARRLGAIPVLIAPSANDSGFEPNRSFLPATTTKAERRAFESDLDAARRLEETDREAAIDRYRELVARQPGFAATHFRLARLLEAKGEWAEAYEHDIRARDADGYPMRCLTPFQEVYRETAARHDCIYIDGQDYLHKVAAHGLLDDGLFHDGMHPSLRGQIALAQAVLRGLHARRAFGWAADAPTPTVDPVECVRRFGLDPGVWRYLCLWGIMFYDRTSPATYDPTRRASKRKEFIAAADKIEAGSPPESVGLPNIGVCEPVPIVPYGNPFSWKAAASP
ncbi:MAG: SGNH/GDSL hydrolase family protein [Paludisphaera borealis]|uniref:SGNH/GDSL hydrolase family protein n=1 Tax=Paludisphaera borealis TaxID=1387353 RepID=UPI002844FBB8|nr:SGNH/GDSL hydrolase family protein [Paludisphaera borealis]MDR3622385.1 SGNH/GDSL hydrolase family protein [Paludisphaera borealis]